MRLLSVIVSLLLTLPVCNADRPIFLVTPGGVFQSIVSDDGKPGPWQKIDADVIVSGFGSIPDTPKPPAPDPPKPPVVDEITRNIELVSRTTLKDKDEATAISAIVDSLVKLDLSADDFTQAMEMSIPIADASLGADGRINTWYSQVSKLSADPSKMMSGLKAAWGVEASALAAIHAASVSPDSVASGEAINWTHIITIIQTILALLKMLGIGGGA